MTFTRGNLASFPRLLATVHYDLQSAAVFMSLRASRSFELPCYESDFSSAIILLKTSEDDLQNDLSSSFKFHHVHCGFFSGFEVDLGHEIAFCQSWIGRERHEQERQQGDDVSSLIYFVDFRITI